MVEGDKIAAVFEGEVPGNVRAEANQVIDATGKWLKISWREFSDKVNAMSYVKQRKMRPLFAYAARCELDNQGRTLFPAHLREYAHLGKGVAVIGCNNHAELWDSEAWAAVFAEETTPENIAAVMEELEF